MQMYATMEVLSTANCYTLDALYSRNFQNLLMSIACGSLCHRMFLEYIAVMWKASFASFFAFSDFSGFSYPQWPILLFCLYHHNSKIDNNTQLLWEAGCSSSSIALSTGFAAVFGAALTWQQEPSQENQDACKCMQPWGYSPQPIVIL